MSLPALFLTDVTNPCGVNPDVDTINNPLTLDEPRNFCFTGPKGSGKTLSMVYVAMHAAVNYGYRLFTSYPLKIAFEVIPGPGRHKQLYESQFIDDASLYSLDRMLDNSVVCFDEAPLSAGDSRSSIQIKNRIMSYAMMQSRKRKLFFMLTSQQFKWVDNRLQYATDILIECMDKALTPWGIREKLVRGSVIQWQLKDLSGSWKGESYYDSGDVSEYDFHARKIWPCYDTYATLNPLDSLRKVRVDMKDIVVSDKDKTSEEDLIYKITHFVQDLIAGGINELASEPFWETLKGAGIEGEHRSLGRLLKQCGVNIRRVGNGDYRYTFAKI